MGDIALRFSYCVRMQGILKWIQMSFGFVILCLICWEGFEGTSNKQYRMVLVDGEQFTIIITPACMVTTFLVLLLLFFNCHRLSDSCQCHIVVNCFFLFAALLYAIAGGVETHATIAFQRRNYGSLFGRRAAAAGLCFMNSILYLLSYVQAKIHNDP